MAEMIVCSMSYVSLKLVQCYTARVTGEKHRSRDIQPSLEFVAVQHYVNTSESLCLLRRLRRFILLSGDASVQPL